MSTFQKTESKSVPWNLSGNPAAVSFGPRRVTNSSKSTWPSPVEKRSSWYLLSLVLLPTTVQLCEHKESKLLLCSVTQDNKIQAVCLPHRPCPVSGWWPPAPPHLACSQGSAWPFPAPALRWIHSHHGQILWRPHVFLQRRHTHTRAEVLRQSRIWKQEMFHAPKTHLLCRINVWVIVIWGLAAQENKYSTIKMTKKQKTNNPAKIKQIPFNKSWDQDKLSTFWRAVCSAFLVF